MNANKVINNLKEVVLNKDNGIMVKLSKIVLLIVSLVLDPLQLNVLVAKQDFLCSMENAPKTKDKLIFHAKKDTN
jgi:hypothetical protein